MEIVESNLSVVVIAAVAVGVDVAYKCCSIVNCAIGIEGFTYTPSVVRVTGYYLGVCIGDGDYVTLQVLKEEVRCAVVGYSTYCILVVVERDKGVIAPSFTKYLSTVEGVIVSDAADGLACSDAVGIVGICIRVKGLELSALFPRERMTEIGRRVALCIVGDSLTVV